MDHSLYKDVTTSRGLKYHYFFSPSVGARPTLLLIHGFPSTSNDWRHQVSFFLTEGYGLIVPDMLGYGGTDKPTDTTLYKYSALNADIIDILNAENVDKVIAIGHDWGSVIVSRLAVYHPDRFLGLGFLAAGYVPPMPEYDIQMHLALTKQAVGYESHGYTLFFSEDGADEIIESHYDSFFSMIYPHDPELWKTDMAPTGMLKKWLLADRQGPLPHYLTEADAQKIKATLLSGGFAAPLRYYRAAVASRVQVEDDKNVPRESYTVRQPVFFGGALRDYICISAFEKTGVEKHCKDFVIKEFDTDHWVQLAAPEAVNKELLAWIKEIEV